MLSLSLTVPLTVLSLIALCINITILLIVILCKQVGQKSVCMPKLTIHYYGYAERNANCNKSDDAFFVYIYIHKQHDTNAIKRFFMLVQPLLNFQVSPSNILLFHLGIIESLLCIVFLVFSVPLLTRGDENATVNTICKLDAFFLTLLHPVALWTVCALNCDRYYAISAPLHYNAIVSSKKVRKIKIQFKSKNIRWNTMLSLHFP